MSRDKKRQMFWYQVDDGEAIARHLEKMAGKGWLLEGVDNWYYTYRRAEPAQVKYAVTFFPDASVFDPGLTEGQETYADYCQAAGWELAAAYGPVQYFRSTRPDPRPIETDEAVKLTAIRRTMRKTFLFSYVLLLLLPAIWLPGSWKRFQRDPMAFSGSDLQLSLLLLMAGIVLFSGGMLLDYLVWVLRSRYAVARGGRCARPHTRFRLGLSFVMIAVCAAALLGYFMESDMRSFLVLFLVIYGGVMLLSRWLLRRLKRSGISRGCARGIYAAFAIAVGIVAGFGAPLLFGGLTSAGIIHMGREPVETYTKTYENVSWTYTREVFRDELPVTLEDLGYTVTPEDHCTCEAEIERSPLAVYSRYTQDALSSDSELPRLACTAYDTSWPWLMDICWEHLLSGDTVYDPVEELTPAPWGAEAAYRQDDVYFLRYPDRIVTFRLSGDDAAPQQLETIALALRP